MTGSLTADGSSKLLNRARNNKTTNMDADVKIAASLAEKSSSTFH